MIVIPFGWVAEAAAAAGNWTRHAEGCSNALLSRDEREKRMRARNIAEVLEILERLIGDFRGRGSRLAYFAALYRGVTLRVKLGIERGEFEDGARMDAF